MSATWAIASTATAPTKLPFDGQTLQIQENTLIAPRIPPTNQYREWVAQYMDLDKIDRYNMVLAKKGVNMDLETILYDLATNESGRNPTQPCIVDVDGFLSCGMYQYHRLTFSGNCQGSIDSAADQTKCTADLIMKGEGHNLWTNSWITYNLPII